MEQLMELNRQARGKLNNMGNRRAMELQLEHPQMMPNQLETTKEMRGSGMVGGGEAGLKRVIGRGRGRPKKVTGCGMTLNDQMEGEGMTLNDQMEGEGMMSGGAKMGKELAEQIKRLHGVGFYNDFTKGMRGGAGGISAPPSGIQVSHARMSPAETGLAGQALGGQDVPPGGLIPIAYGNTPQAPASFARNTVGAGRKSYDEGAGMTCSSNGRGRPAGAGMTCSSNGRGRPAGAGMSCSSNGATKGRGRPKKTHTMPDGTVMPGATHGGAMKLLGRPGHGTQQGGAMCSSMKVDGGKRSARGQAVAKLMKTKGMTLPQASKYLKEHGSN